MAAVGTSGTLAADGLAVLGDALAQLGHWDDALTHGTAAQAVARETGIPFDMNVANYHLARTFLARGDPESALPLIAWNIEFGERCGLRMVLRWHDALLGHAYMLQGRFDEAIERLDVAIAGCTAMQLLWTSTFGLLIKAETLLAAGQKAAAEGPAAEALRLARRHGYKAFEAGARRVLASCMWESDLAAARKNLTIAQATAVSENMVAELEAIASTRLSLRADSTANI